MTRRKTPVRAILPAYARAACGSLHEQTSVAAEEQLPLWDVAHGKLLQKGPRL